MTDEELKLVSHRVLGMEHYQDEVQYICEGDADCAEVISLLQDNSITGKDRTNLKEIAFPFLHGTSRQNMITYSSARAGGTSMRSIGRLHTFVNMYGSRYKYIPTKVKKGFGKGKPRLQKVITKSRNSFDNLTWLDGK
jgi:hypothetical protein|tara:strand:- start:1551 stop:1964 length:414 start_codon:yes stop_codon:yes gene_type:complete